MENNFKMILLLIFMISKKMTVWNTVFPFPTVIYGLISDWTLVVLISIFFPTIFPINDALYLMMCSINLYTQNSSLLSKKLHDFYFCTCQS